MVYYNYVTGFPNTVFTPLNRAIGQYKNRYFSLKVGITGQYPERRFSQHKLHRPGVWSQMVVIYRTSSESHANLLENWLVDHHWDRLVNDKSGGGSRLSTQDGWYYVYVLLG